MARRGLGSDPWRSFNFIVSIVPYASPVPSSMKNIGKLGFQSVTGISFQNDEIDYREGGDNTTVRKMPGLTTFSDVTFAQGVGGTPELGGTQYTGQELSDWTRLIFSATAGGGLNSGGVNFRASIAIDVLEYPITSGASYSGMPRGTGTWPIKWRIILINAWPKSLSFSDLNAQTDAVFIQSLTVAHEGFQVYYASPGNSTSYLSNTLGLTSSTSSSSASSAANSAANAVNNALGAISSFI